MPDWCTNIVIFAGTEEQINALQSHVAAPDGSTAFSLAAIRPEPEDVAASAKEPEDVEGGPDVSPDALAAFALPAWYQWRGGNWGCKWDVRADAPDLYALPGLLAAGRWTCTYRFDSAWAPPIEALDFLARVYLGNITLQYYEEGADIAGEYLWRNGSLIDKTEGEPLDFDFYPGRDDENDEYDENDDDENDDDDDDTPSAPVFLAGRRY